MCNMNQSLSPQSEIACRNKINSDIADTITEGLTVRNSHMSSSHGKAAKDNRDRIMELEIERLECIDSDLINLM